MNAGRKNDLTALADKKTEDNDSADKKAEEAELDPLEKAQKEVEDLKKQLLYKTAEFDRLSQTHSQGEIENWYSMVEKKQFQPFCQYSMILSVPLLIRVKTLKAIKEGVQMIFNKFIKTLEGLGVKKMRVTDKDFDVDFHEAIAMVPGMGDDKKGKVIDCVQTGYTLNDKVIRHAKVAVGQ